MSIAWHEWVGLAGVLLILLAFFMLQARKLSGHGLIYQLMNALGAIGVMISLIVGKGNLPALLLEVAWLLISVFGIIMAARRRRDAAGKHRQHTPY